MSTDIVRSLALAGPALLLSLSVHEFAHAWAATKLGDGTPKAQGRLTLNPMSHIDWFGTVLFPAVLLVISSGTSFFGWAKPVQFNPSNFTRKISWRKGAALTALAGPMSNVLLALIALLVVRLLFGTDALAGLPGRAGQNDHAVSLDALWTQCASCGLQPASSSPLDGSYLLPRSMDDAKAWLSRYSLIIFALLFFLPFPGLGFPLGHMVMQPLMLSLENILRMVANVGL